MARPDVISRAATAPVKGQGLGSTIWYACAWWAIRRFLVGKGLGEERKRKLESLRQQLLGVLEGIIKSRLGWQQWALMGEERMQLLRLVELEGGRL
jgi:hypothetical protein